MTGQVTFKVSRSSWQNSLKPVGSETGILYRVQAIYNLNVIMAY